CPLAPANRYLPARSGCVTAMRADMTGDGRADLVIVYSHLNHTSAYYAGGPAAWKHYFGAGDATIEVVIPGGKTISTRLTAIRAPGYSVNAAAIIAVKHVSDEPGDEFFLQITQISSGSTALAYGLADGRLVPSGVLLHYGGDSAQRAGFSCQAATRTPELVQRTFLLGDAPALGARARWMGTKLTYAWHGPRLVKIHTQTIHAAGHRPPSQLVGGSGCGPVKS
ncbi:MAG: hypothetical protein FWD04_10170, partial [Conexibacteraceae bacterium]|nr:hypothetical protein [Conexibacteraceae bacterium]